MYKIFYDSNNNPYIRGNDANETLPVNLPMGTTATFVDPSDGTVVMKSFDEETRSWTTVDDGE